MSTQHILSKYKLASVTWAQEDQRDSLTIIGRLTISNLHLPTHSMLKV